MLTGTKDSIEDLPVTVQALTQEEAGMIQGGDGWGFVKEAAKLLYKSITDYDNAPLTKVGRAIGDGACKLTKCNQ